MLSLLMVARGVSLNETRRREFTVRAVCFFSQLSGRRIQALGIGAHGSRRLLREYPLAVKTLEPLPEHEAPARKNCWPDFFGVKADDCVGRGNVRERAALGGAQNCDPGDAVIVAQPRIDLAPFGTFEPG